MNDHKFELLLPVNVIKQRFQSIFFNNYLSLCECFKKRFIKTINTYSKLLFDSNKQSYERGKQLMGQWWTSVWFRWMGTANGRVNHTRAQAETHVHSDKVRWGGGHAELTVLVEVGWGGDAGWIEVLLVHTETGWNQYQDKLTLNSSTSSSCKQEAWRLKRDFKTSSGVGVDKTMLRSCHNRQTRNDWRWDDTRHMTSPHINLKSASWCGLVHRGRCDTFWKNLCHVWYDAETSLK